MAVEILFKGTNESLTEQVALQAYITQRNELYIQLEGDGLENICLDKDTAIALVEHIDKLISQL